MKKWIAIVLALLMVLPLAACKKGTTKTETKEQAQQTEPSVEELSGLSAEDYDQTGTCGESAHWGFKEESGELTIVGQGSMEDYTYANRAPWKDLAVKTAKISGVSTIGDYAFFNCSSLTAVELSDMAEIGDYAFCGCYGLAALTLPDSVTVVGEHTFEGCYGLTSVELGAGLTTIKKMAFALCDSLTEIELPDSVTTLGEKAFSGCRLTSVKLPDGLLTMDADVFEGCNITSINLPDSMTVIGANAFTGFGFTDLVIPDRVTVIGMEAFASCDMKTLKMGDSVTTIEEAAFSTCDTLEEVTLSRNLTAIGRLAFMGCTALRQVEFPQGLTTIEEAAFRRCFELTEITIPDSVTTIGDDAFADCISLTDIHVDENNPSYLDVDGVFFSKDQKTLILYPMGREEDSYTIPEGVTTIEYGAFAYCGASRPPVFPDMEAYKKWTEAEPAVGLTSITIPVSVTSIGESAFNWAYGLTDVYYGGTEEQWNAIEIADWNDVLSSATIHFNS